MKKSIRMPSIALALCLLVPATMSLECFSADSKTEKELKRTAQRYRIPVEQLKNARAVLQEATDLAKSMDPIPTAQLSSLASAWTQFNRPRAEPVIESMILDIWYRAAESDNMADYQKTVSAALSLFNALSNLDYEKALSLVSTWPDPPPDLGEAAYKARDQMINQVKRIALMRMVNDDPEAAAGRLALLEDSDTNSTGTSAMLINSLMNAGKKVEARKIINQTMQKFETGPENSNDFRNYQNYLQTVIRYMDDADARASADQLVRTIRQAPPNPPGFSGPDYTLDPAYIIEKGDKSMEVTGAEQSFLSILRNLQSRPRLLMEILDTYPELKSKLEDFGGIDNYMSYGMNPADTMKTRSIQSQKSPGINDEYQLILSSGIGGSNQGIQDTLYRELRKKAATDPAGAKAKLRKEAKGKESINMLINLAQKATYEYPDLAGIALELAQDLIPEIENPSLRSTVLQQLVRAYRNLDGEVSEELIRSGYILADDMRQQEELSRQSAQPVPGAVIPFGSMSSVSNADRLEIFLVSELARDSFDQAIRFARTIEDDALRLEYLVQIAQKLGSSY